MDPTSPYKNRGDIIEVKISGKSSEITRLTKEKDQGNTKAQNAASSCHRNTDMRKEKTLVG